MQIKQHKQKTKKKGINAGNILFSITSFLPTFALKSNLEKARTKTTKKRETKKRNNNTADK